MVRVAIIANNLFKVIINFSTSINSFKLKKLVKYFKLNLVL